MSRAGLRILAVIFVIADSVGTYIPGAPMIFQWLGRLAAPCFLFCMAWSMDKVKNRRQYLLILYGCSVGMGILNFVFSMPSLFPVVATAASGNLFATMFASGCMIEVFEYQREHPEKRLMVWGIYVAWQLGGAAVWCVLSEIVMVPTNTLQIIFTVCGNVFLAEGSFLLVFLGFLLYYTKKNRRAMRFCYFMIFFVYFINASTGLTGRVMSFLGSDILMVVAELLTGLSMYGTWVTANFSLDHMLFHDYQWMMFAALPILLFCKENGVPAFGKKPLWYLSGALYPVSLYFLWFFGNYLL